MIQGLPLLGKRRSATKSTEIAYPWLGIGKRPSRQDGESSRLTGIALSSMRVVLIVTLAAGGAAVVLWRRAAAQGWEIMQLGPISLLRTLFFDDGRSFVQSLSQEHAACLAFLRDQQSAALGAVAISSSSRLLVDERTRKPSNAFQDLEAFDASLAEDAATIVTLAADPGSTTSLQALQCVELITAYQKRRRSDQPNYNPNDPANLFLEDLKHISARCLGGTLAIRTIAATKKSRRNLWGEEEDSTLLTKLQQSTEVTSIASCVWYVSSVMKSAELYFREEASEEADVESGAAGDLSAILGDVRDAMTSGLVVTLKQCAESRLASILHELSEHMLQYFHQGRHCLRALLLSDTDGDLPSLGAQSGKAIKYATLDSILQQTVQSVEPLQKRQSAASLNSSRKKKGSAARSTPRPSEDCDDVFKKLRKQFASLEEVDTPARSALRVLEQNSLFAAAATAVKEMEKHRQKAPISKESKMLLDLRERLGDAAELAIDASALLQRLATLIGWTNEAFKIIDTEKTEAEAADATIIRWASPISSSMSSPVAGGCGASIKPKFRNAASGLLDLPVSDLVEAVGMTIKSLRRKLKMLYRAAAGLDKASHGSGRFRGMPQAMTALGHLSQEQGAVAELTSKVRRAALTLENHLERLLLHDTLVVEDSGDGAQMEIARSPLPWFSLDSLCSSWRLPSPELEESDEEAKRPGASTSENDEEQEKEVTASKSMIGTEEAPPAPWVVMESRRHPGKFYFYNTTTEHTRWTLNRWFKSAPAPKTKAPVVKEGSGPSAMGALRERMVKHLQRYAAAERTAVEV